MSLAEEARNVRERIAERLRELEPLAREYEELKRVAAEMGIEPADGSDEPPGSEPRPTARGRRTAVQRPQSERAQTDRPAPAAELLERVIEAVRSEPGKTVGEYAAILGVSQTALYRPVRELTNSRVIVKRARQLFPG